MTKKYFVPELDAVIYAEVVSETSFPYNDNGKIRFKPTKVPYLRTIKFVNNPMEISVGEVKILAKAIAEIEIENGTYFQFIPSGRIVNEVKN